ncbi:MAG TPA: RING finger protein [Planctomycetota bacterium]|nr:RING finger protein [Planctomycetota bacterium]
MSMLLHGLAHGDSDFPVVLLGAVVLVGVLMAASHRNQRTDVTKRIREVAGHLRGSFIPGGMTELPSIRLAIRGMSARMTFTLERRSSTTLEVVLPRLFEGRMRLHRKESGRTLAGFLGSGVRGVGDRSFDSTFVVTSDPESLTRRIFSPDRVPDVVRTVRRLEDCPGLLIRLEPGRLTIQIADCRADYSRALCLRQTAEELVDYVVSMPEPGIQWGESAEERTGRCPICAAGLREPLVRCDRCRSPHHRECWDYLGHCATYGCDRRPGHRAA